MEVFVGEGIRKLYGQITYSSEISCFVVPVTREETFTLPENEENSRRRACAVSGGMVLGVIDELKAGRGRHQ